ncbi:MAG: hypothetical protein M3R38_31835 [Actinomycetota bacterium]|nr:hypothetical protein [Actinomycetota bacterium]
MTAANLTPLLVRARDAGLTLRAEDGYIVATPKARLEPELREEIVRHKAGLLEALVWDEDAAYDLARKALSFLNDSHQRAGAPDDFSLEPLDGPERRINAACEERDMFVLRIAYREWVQAGLEGVKRAQRARDEAEDPVARAEAQRDVLRVDRDRRASDIGVRSRRRERGVREPAGAGS